MNLISNLARFAATVALATTTLISSAEAQGTTGVPGLNDYTIAGMFSGSSSCGFLPGFPGGSVQPHTISTTPNTQVAWLFTLSPNCLCRPCFFPFPNQGACPPPPNTACPTTNQSLDIVLGCGIIAVSGISDAAGFATLNVTMPPPGFAYGTQAVAFQSCATPPFPFLLTQAYATRTF